MRPVFIRCDPLWGPGQFLVNINAIQAIVPLEFTDQTINGSALVGVFPDGSEPLKAKGTPDFNLEAIDAALARSGE